MSMKVPEMEEELTSTRSQAMIAHPSTRALMYKSMLTRRYLENPMVYASSKVLKKVRPSINPALGTGFSNHTGYST